MVRHIGCIRPKHAGTGGQGRARGTACPAAWLHVADTVIEALAAISAATTSVPPAVGSFLRMRLPRTGIRPSTAIIGAWYDVRFFPRRREVPTVQMPNHHACSL